MTLGKSRRPVASGDGQSRSHSYVEPWATDPTRVVPIAQIRTLLADHLYCINHPKWESLTHSISTEIQLPVELGGSSVALSEDAVAWYQARNAGLRAYSVYAATLFLGEVKKSGMNEIDFLEFKLMQTKEIENPEFDALIAAKRQEVDLQLLERFFRGLNQNKPHEVVTGIKLYAAFYDRLAIPLEYWTDSASASYMTRLFRTKGRPTSGFSTGQLKRWRAKQLGGLRLASPTVVGSFADVSGAFEPVVQAGFRHGIPMFLVKRKRR